MAAYCVPRDPLTWLIEGARRVLLSACTVALVSCGGEQSGPAAPVDSALAAGADSAAGPSIALDPPGTVGLTPWISLTWQAPSSLTSFTVFVQRGAGQAFEAVDAVVAGQYAQFLRGAAYRLDFPTARVRVRGCTDANQCVDSNEQPLLDALLAGLGQLTAQSFGGFFMGTALSADGGTLAVSGSHLPLITGVESLGSVAVYWRGEDCSFGGTSGIVGNSAPGTAVALSGDGDTVIHGTSSAQDGAGNIRVHTREGLPPARIQAAVPVAGEGFGAGVATSHDGNRTVVTDLANRIYVLEREAGQWRQANVIESGPGKSFFPPATIAMSADASSIAVPVLFQPDMTMGVHVYKSCSCDGGWQLVAELRSAKPPLPRAEDDGFGRTLSFSRDGNTLAVGAWRDSSDASDNGTTVNPGSTASGAVYIFGADDGGTWQRRAFLKAKTAPSFDQLGVRVSLSGDGKVLMAGACGFAANANGLRRNHRAGATIGPPGVDNSRCEFGGSGYVFEADGRGVWSHTAAAIAAPGEAAQFGDFSALDGGCSACGFSLSMSANAQGSALLARVRGASPNPDRVVLY